MGYQGNDGRVLAHYPCCGFQNLQESQTEQVQNSSDFEVRKREYERDRKRKKQKGQWVGWCRFRKTLPLRLYRKRGRWADKCTSETVCLAWPRMRASVSSIESMESTAKGRTVSTRSDISISWSATSWPCFEPRGRTYQLTSQLSQINREIVKLEIDSWKDEAGEGIIFSPSHFLPCMTARSRRTDAYHAKSVIRPNFSLEHMNRIFAMISSL